MNNDYYQQVLEDVQKDLAEVEETVTELHGIERYVQRKMEREDGDAKLTYDQYQSLLEDVRQDVDGARSKIGELRGVGNFAREKLKAAGIQVGELKSSPAKASPKPSPPPPAKAEKPAELPPEDDADATQNEPSPLRQAGKVDTMQTVEFGPDGFPMSK